MSLLFRSFEIPNKRRPGARGMDRADPEKSLRIRWLGTAGYELSARGTTILLDPFVSRPGLRKLLTNSRIRPDAGAAARYFPEADYILTGHSHFDHVMDVPAIALRTGASVIGSRSTCVLAAAAGVPTAKIREVPPTGGRFELGPFEVRLVPSRHGRFFFGRVPLVGEIDACPTHGDLRVRDFKVGDVFGIWLKVGDLTLYHNGSADLIDAELEGLEADVVFMGLAGRFATRDYIPRLIGFLKPKWIVPTHYDGFFAPLEEGLTLLPGIKLRGFFRQSEAAAPRAEIVMPDYEEPMWVGLGKPNG